MASFKLVIEERYKKLRALGADCFQDLDELAELAAIVEALEPRRIVEIGTCDAGWLYLLAPFFAPGAEAIAVDPDVHGRAARRKKVVAELADTLSVTMVHGYSEFPATRRRVEHLLGGRRADFLHIDGRHTYEAARSDWENYSPLVRPGGAAVFHDINLKPGGAGFTGEIGVYRYWEEEIVPVNTVREICLCENRRGVGIVAMGGS